MAWAACLSGVGRLPGELLSALLPADGNEDKLSSIEHLLCAKLYESQGLLCHRHRV